MICSHCVPLQNKMNPDGMFEPIDLFSNLQAPLSIPLYVQPRGGYALSWVPSRHNHTGDNREPVDPQAWAQSIYEGSQQETGSEAPQSHVQSPSLPIDSIRAWRSGVD